MACMTLPSCTSSNTRSQETVYVSILPEESKTSDAPVQVRNEAPTVGEENPEYHEVDLPFITDTFNDGWNTLNGSFNYKGAEYPFEINFCYNRSTGTVTEALYIATGTGSKNKINSMRFNYDGTEFWVKGPKLEIHATAPDLIPKYKGTMTRGTHSGTIKVWM